MSKNLWTYWRSVKSEDKSLIIYSIIIWVMTRFVGIGTFLTVDEPTWIERSTLFVKALLKLNFAATYQAATEQAAHPGALLMWLGGTGVVFKNIIESFFDIPFYLEISLIKLPLVVFSALVFALIVYTLSKIFNKNFAVFSLVFISFEPFLIAYTRLIHLDGILSLLIFASVLLVLYALKKNSTQVYIMSAFVAGLAFATKVPSLSLIPFVFVVTMLIKKLSLKDKLIKFVVWLLIAFSVLFILWPALWVDPMKAVSSIFGAANKGITVNHEGTMYTLQPLFYINSLITYLSPWGIVLFVVGFINMIYLLVRRKPDLNLWLLLAFSIYFIVGMTLGAKKGERYILPSYPFILTISAYGGFKLFQLTAKRVRLTFLALIAGVILYVLSYHPYYISFYNRLTRQPQKIGLGEGLEKSAYYLNNKPDSKGLTVAAWYSNVFSKYFIGRTIDLDRRSEADYVVIYRNMSGRAQEDPVTKIYQEYLNKRPEYTIYIHGIEYAWIFQNEK